MELSILLLEDALRQQKEQLNDTEKRNIDPNAPAFEFRKKATLNVKSFIADLEKAIEALTLLSKQDEALILPVVVRQSEQFVCDVNDKKTICKNPLSYECCNKHHKRI